MQRRHCALGAIAARAGAAGYADRRGDLRVGKIKAVGLDHLASVTDVAAERNGVLTDAMRQPASGGEGLGALRRLGDAEIALAVGHLRDLHAQHARRRKGIVDVPARAGDQPRKPIVVCRSSGKNPPATPPAGKRISIGRRDAPLAISQLHHLLYVMMLVRSRRRGRRHAQERQKKDAVGRVVGRCRRGGCHAGHV